jgi:hypothetical protein
MDTPEARLFPGPEDVRATGDVTRPTGPSVLLAVGGSPDPVRNQERQCARVGWQDGVAQLYLALGPSGIAQGARHADVYDGRGRQQGEMRRPGLEAADFGVIGDLATDVSASPSR